MVYDQVTCPHHNSVIGHMHGAVYRYVVYCSYRQASLQKRVREAYLLLTSDMRRRNILIGR